MRQVRRFNRLRDAATIIWPGHGAWLYDTWAELNAELFDDKLAPIGLMFGLTPHGHALGYYRTDDKTITLHTSLIDPKSSDPWYLGDVLGRGYARDVLVHEMTHQSVQQKHGTTRDRMGCHNNTMWVDEVNRISPMLGLKVKAAVVKQKRVRAKGQRAGNGKVQWVVEPGCLTRMELAHWPHSCRSKTYYKKAA